MIRRGSGNPFADAGLEAAGELAVKHEAVALIAAELEWRGMSQAELARASGLQPQHLTEIMHRRLDRFSIDRLNRVLAVFGARIDVTYGLSGPKAA